MAHNFTDAEVKVREATSNDPWGPSNSQMADIADLTHDETALNEIMQMIWKRLNDGKNWRHVYKGLVLLDYIIRAGSEKVAELCKEKIFKIIALKDFYIELQNKDQGANVREKAKAILSLISDDELLKNERVKALEIKERFDIIKAGSSICSESVKNTGLSKQGGGEEDQKLGATGCKLRLEVKYKIIQDRTISSSTDPRVDETSQSCVEEDVTLGDEDFKLQEANIEDNADDSDAIMSLALERRKLEESRDGDMRNVVLEADSTYNDVFDTESSGPQKQIEINVDPWNLQDTPRLSLTEVTDSIPSNPLNCLRVYPMSPNKESQRLINQQCSPNKVWSYSGSWDKQERALGQTFHVVREQNSSDPWGLQVVSETTSASMGSLLDLSIEEKVPSNLNESSLCKSRATSSATLQFLEKHSNLINLDCLTPSQASHSSNPFLARKPSMNKLQKEHSKHNWQVSL